MLIQINVILLGSAILGDKVLGYIRYLQNLRAICGIVAFECLGKALDRTTLAKATPDRQLALVVQAALLLDEVVETRGESPASVVCFVHDKVYGDMHQHLIQFISHYIRKLISDVFGKACVLNKRLQKTRCGDHLGETFWDMLSDLLPSIPLRKPPKLRNHETGDTGVHRELLNRIMISPKCPIACN
jgi:hypothetical protein